MEIAQRKEYLGFSEKDAKLLESVQQDITDNIEDIVETFYKNILSLFEGQYDEEYVHSRLRVGMIHKGIGLDPKYYVAAVHITITDTLVKNLYFQSG